MIHRSFLDRSIKKLLHGCKFKKENINLGDGKTKIGGWLCDKKAMRISYTCATSLVCGQGE